MQNERENFLAPITWKDYDVAGNVFRAFYDADNKLVFVLDYTIDNLKPNVLLTINPVGNRKWDDILMNDYGVDLETVRPKKDNKYQKLDIEYSGLSQYDELIRAFNAGDDLSNAVRGVAQFKRAAARRAAEERLGAAEATLVKSRATIEKTQDTISELQARMKMLRSKLAAQRADIGREPTKNSAAKILRTEALIDATGAKLQRAKKRLQNAQARLSDAEEDAATAREILGALENNQEIVNVPAQPAPTSMAAVEEVAVPMEIVPQFTEIIPAQSTTQQPKAEEMADEEVKPLFDKDPEILDEEIAFKPIDFNVPVTNDVKVPAQSDVAAPQPIQPISFVPPVVPDTAATDVVPAPVLDTITSVEMPVEETIVQEETFVPQPVTTPVAPVADDVVAPVQPMPEISDAPTYSGARPVSPITGGVAPVTQVQRKPTMIYYVMLLLLIVMSIFTLWIYQNSANDSVPELGATSQPVVETAAPVATEPVTDTSAEEPVESPFIGVEQVEVPAPVVTESVDEVSVAEVEEPAAELNQLESEEVPVADAPAEELELVVAETQEVPVVPAEDEVEVVSAVVEPVPVVAEEPVVESDAPDSDSPFLSDAVVEKVESQPIAEVLANKPAYNVSQQENMFVAAADYETDMPVEEDTFVVEEVETCADGNMPDADGCCAGEYFADMGNGEYACCSEKTDECFPPMM